MTNENRCGSKGRRAKKKLSHPGDEISKFQEVEGGGGGRREKGIRVVSEQAKSNGRKREIHISSIMLAPITFVSGSINI